MKTPICDFVNSYKNKNPLRLHMPGHKGNSCLGFEEYDITEINGADCLYFADGIIKKSQQNVAKIFGTKKTLYSAEGSSLSIRAMLYLTLLFSKSKGEKCNILAARNIHKSFLSAAALLDIEVSWLETEGDSFLSCQINYNKLEKRLAVERPIALYITTPDYLGGMVNVKKIAELCHKNQVLLLVDNAHGAYLKFLSKSLHPIDLGADICADSAHKTLPVITGGGYLHISKNAPTIFLKQAEKAMMLFASTSPSYLILQSLDMANKTLSENYKKTLNSVLLKVEQLKKKLVENGFILVGKEPLKLTIMPKPFGYTGYELAELLKQKNIFAEFQDPDFLVLMFSADSKDSDFNNLEEAFLCLPKKEKINTLPPKIKVQERVLSLNQALKQLTKRVKVEKSMGKIVAEISVSCPPAVPIAVLGEKITKETIENFKYYGIKEIEIIK